MARILDAIGQHQITKPADRRTQHVQLVIQLILAVQPLVLQHQRYVIQPPALRQRQSQALLIVENEEPRQPHGHLMTGLAVGMGVIPAGGGGLLDAKCRSPLLAGGNTGLGAAICGARHLQPVPVYRAGLGQPVADADPYRLPLPGSQRGAEQVAVIAPAVGRLTPPVHLTRLSDQLDHPAFIRFEHGGNGQGEPLGGEGPAPPGQGAGGAERGGEFEKIATLHESILVGRS